MGRKNPREAREVDVKWVETTQETWCRGTAVERMKIVDVDGVETAKECKIYSYGNWKAGWLEKVDDEKNGRQGVELWNSNRFFFTLILLDLLLLLL